MYRSTCAIQMHACSAGTCKQQCTHALDSSNAHTPLKTAMRARSCKQQCMHARVQQHRTHAVARDSAALLPSVTMCHTAASAARNAALLLAHMCVPDGETCFAAVLSNSAHPWNRQQCHAGVLGYSQVLISPVMALLHAGEEQCLPSGLWQHAA